MWKNCSSIGGAENEFSRWSLEVKYRPALVEEGSVGALEWAEESVDEVAPEKVRTNTATSATSMEQLGETLLRAAGAKVKGEA